MGAKIKNPSSSAPRLWKITIMCRGQINGSFRKQPILVTKTRNLTPIMSEDLFFEDHLILGTKFNKNSLKVPRCLRNFKNMPQTEKLEKHCLNLLIKDVDFFKQKAETLIKSRHDQSGMKDTMSGLKASYEVLQKIVAAKKPHALENS